MRKGTKRQIAVSACIPVLMFIAIRSIAYTAAHLGQTAFAYILEFLILAACCGAAAVLITLYLRSIRDRRRFKSMSDAVDKMSVFAVIWDRQRRQFYANNTFRDATHYTIEDLYDKKYMDRIFPEDAWQVGRDGKRMHFFCPRSPAVLDFQRDFTKTILKVAKPDSYWLDDDLRMGVSKPDGCFCPRCIAAFNAKTGGSWTREALVAKLYSGAAREPVRAAWMKLQSVPVLSSSMKMAACPMRRLLPREPKIRMSPFCRSESWPVSSRPSTAWAGTVRPSL